MESTTKIIVGGSLLFLLGAGATYWLLADKNNTSRPHTGVAAQHQPAMQAALAQLDSSANEAEDNTTNVVPDNTPNNTAESENTSTLTHEGFLAAAEARRAQQMMDKAETDRLNKLRQIKADSVDCKFWRQQQQTSSTAEKIEEKIKTHCFIARDLANSESSSSGPANEQ